MSENHKLFGHGEKRRSLSPEDTAVLKTRDAVMNGGVYWVFYAMHRVNPLIAKAVEAELATTPVPAAVSPDTLPEFTQNQEHLLLANAAMAASLNTVNPVEAFQDAQTTILDNDEPQVNSEMLDAMQGDITPDNPQVTAVQERQGDYELAR